MTGGVYLKGVDSRLNLAQGFLDNFHTCVEISGENDVFKPEELFFLLCAVKTK